MKQMHVDRSSNTCYCSAACRVNLVLNIQPFNYGTVIILHSLMKFIIKYAKPILFIKTCVEIKSQNTTALQLASIVLLYDTHSI